LVDAYVTNVDRTPRNANLLMWHRRLWLIDHGAALYFHHTWTNYLERSRDAFTMIKDHVLLRSASVLALRAADARMAELATPEVISEIVKSIPDEWLAAQSQVGDSPFAGPAEYRDAYVEYLLSRLEARQVFLEEAIRARSLSV
jgi:hypothetical protein